MTTTRTPPARVSALRTLSIVLAFTAAVGLVFGTAGFSAMEADRGLAVNVTDDDEAYLGYEPLVVEDERITENTSKTVVQYRNQFGVDLDTLVVDVSSEDPGSGPTVGTFDAPDKLERGTAGSVSVTLECSTEQEVELEFEATGSGSGASVSLDRTLNVTCVPEPEKSSGIDVDSKDDDDGDDSDDNDDDDGDDSDDNDDDDDDDDDNEDRDDGDDDDDDDDDDNEDGDDDDD
jgi:hypothetical protein